MKRVLVLSPYKGDIEANVAYGWRCVLDSLKRKEAPFASHLFYTSVMDDSDPAQRSLGFACEEVWLECAEIVAVYIDRGLSRGMVQTINLLAKHRVIHIPVEMRSIE